MKPFEQIIKTIAYLILGVICISLNACSKKSFGSLQGYQFKSVEKKPDYTNIDYWAAHPWKNDPSDSVPKPLRTATIKDSTVDVFFIHPTTLTEKNDNRWNADIDDGALNYKTDYSTILYQASAFNENSRIFAPRYRQAHIRAFFIPKNDAQAYFDTAYADINNAFDYYLKELNNGRPIIIAAHSQGTLHAARLLKEYFDGTALQNKLVCAYLLGLPVPENYFEKLPSCKDSTGTSCFVSWRTYKRGYTEPDFVAKENFKAVVVNPLSWTMDTAFISAKYNTGAVLKKFNKIVPNAVNTNIHGNVLWSGKPNVFGKFLYTQKNYHIGDINLFYMNIRQNVKTRIGLFWKK
jgi:pimeloyl-ACP methyl ester carboxylesterase